MKLKAGWLSGAAVVAAVALLGFTRWSITAPPLLAQSNGQSEVQIGFAIAPVTLNMKGKNPALVGKGSYLVNAKGDCNGCHNSPDLGGEFAPGHNPFFGQPKQVNANGYLGGGEQFGPFPGLGPGGAGQLFVYPRNLTPDISGRPIGGATFQEFQAIMRTGHDFDNAHPACPTLGVEGCFASPFPPAPFDPTLLQVMPWPVFANMSDDDLRAIYEYLSAIPCISHAQTPGLPAILYQTCP